MERDCSIQLVEDNKIFYEHRETMVSYPCASKWLQVKSEVIEKKKHRARVQEEIKWYSFHCTIWGVAKTST